MRIKLNRSGLKALSNLCTNFSAVLLGSVAIQSFLLDTFQWPLLVWGLTGTGMLGYMAVFFAQKGKL